MRSPAKRVRARAQSGPRCALQNLMPFNVHYSAGIIINPCTIPEHCWRRKIFLDPGVSFVFLLRSCPLRPSSPPQLQPPIGPPRTSPAALAASFASSANSSTSARTSPPRSNNVPPPQASPSSPDPSAPPISPSSSPASPTACVAPLSSKPRSSAAPHAAGTSRQRPSACPPHEGHAPPRRSRPRTTQPEPQPGDHAQDPRLARLPTEDEIAAAVRRRPVGAVIADICGELGIAPGHLDQAFWDEIRHAITMYGGSLVSFFGNLDRRLAAFCFGDLSDRADPGWPTTPARSPAPSTGPP